MQRQDMFLQKRVMDGNVATPNIDKLKSWVLRANQIPLIYMGDKDVERDPVLSYQPEMENDPVLIAEAVHDEYVFMAALTGDKRDVRLGLSQLKVWAYIKNFHPDEEAALAELNPKEGRQSVTGSYKFDWENRRTTFISMIISHSEEKLWTEWSGILTEDNLERDAFTLTPTTECAEYYINFMENGWKPESNDFLDAVRDVALRVFGGVRGLNNYLKYEDKHLVEVLPAKPKPPRNTPLTKNRPWLNATGPHILLLDRMPTTQNNSHQGGTHASPKPHRRRGHWKTLQHPKYRHHPQYKKKIYIKPSFVGPKQVTYEGNIYRLVEPIEDIAMH